MFLKAVSAQKPADKLVKHHHHDEYVPQEISLSDDENECTPKEVVSNGSYDVDSQTKPINVKPNNQHYYHHHYPKKSTPSAYKQPRAYSKPQEYHYQQQQPPLQSSNNYYNMPQGQHHLQPQQLSHVKYAPQPTTVHTMMAPQQPTMITRAPQQPIAMVSSNPYPGIQQIPLQAAPPPQVLHQPLYNNNQQYVAQPAPIPTRPATLLATPQSAHVQAFGSMMTQPKQITPSYLAVLDTSSVITGSEAGLLDRIIALPPVLVVIPYMTLQELDRQKTFGMPESRAAIRSLNRHLSKQDGKVIVQKSDEVAPFSQLLLASKLGNDDYILNCAMYYQQKYPKQKVLLITEDLNLQNKAMGHSVSTMKIKQFCSQFGMSVYR